MDEPDCALPVGTAAKGLVEAAGRFEQIAPNGRSDAETAFQDGGPLVEDFKRAAGGESAQHVSAVLEDHIRAEDVEVGSCPRELRQRFQPLRFVGVVRVEHREELSLRDRQRRVPR